ncbi:permease [Gemmatirosa kalamazoonensis]|uniref:Permease n=1 Tax=Gemmatirosa kalamazoonensis TaxID=861299 RepID=W0R9Q1_9BACT|nr:ADOP family duplicated permease [Gemmatirosa kalamazoonensis]AHG87824.1 permease [Gemmatirosa kalamazoonensis]
MSTDLRLVLRLLRRAPAFTFAAVLCLAVGLGANTVAFSLLDAVALRPIPFPDAERLVDVHETSATKLCAGCGVGTSYEGFLDWKRDARSFDAMGAYVERGVVLGGDEGTVAAGRARRVAERVQGAVATAPLLALVGARPVLGRSLVAADEGRDAVRVVVLGHALWQRRFGGDSSIVGRTVRLNGLAHVVVGVLAPRFRFPEFAELWVPLTPSTASTGRDARELGVVARLRRGVGAPAASAEMATLARAIERAHPETQAEWSAAVTPLRTDMAGDEAIFGWTLFGAVVLVQLVVCANLAGLLLARAAGRWRELAVRAALGAGGRQLARHVIVEVAVLAAMGAAAGFLAARAALTAIAAQVEGSIPYWIELRMDWRAVLFCVGVTALTVAIVGGGVARRAARPDVQAALKDSAPTASATRRQSRMRDALVVGELAASLMLLAGAGLLVKTSLRLMRPAEGADATRLVSADVALLDTLWVDSSRVAAAAEQLAERVTRLPGVEAAGASRFEFLAGFGASDRAITIEGGATPAGASPRFAYAVTPGWWQARALRAVSGRLTTAADGAGAEPVVVINEAMARRLWPGASALGRRLKLGPSEATVAWRTVVGVVADEPRTGTSTRVQNLAYVPFAQWPGRPLSVLARARTPADVRALVAAIPGAVAAALPEEPVERVQTLAAGARATARPFWLIAVTLTALSAFAVLVTAVGVYGVIAYGVARRTREIGIRLTLGATRRDILALVGGRAVRLAAAGAALGLLGAAASTRVMRGMLLGTDPLDPGVLFGVTVLLSVVAVGAGAIPARRAARVEPTIALRAE